MRIAIDSMASRPDRARQSRADVFGNDPQSFRSDFTERKPGVPQLLLVEQPVPGSTVLPHYHAQDQFQVFIDGNGMLGAHDVGSVTLHYTNRYTGYGPIVAGEQGLSYYVLRPSFDTLGTGQYLVVPELREKLKRHAGPKRSVVAEPVLHRTSESLRSLLQPEVRRLIEGRDTDAERGLWADEICLGPGMDYVGASPAAGSGQMLLVLSGGISQGDATLRTRGGLAVTPDEPPLCLRGLDDGAHLLFMQYPARTPEGLA
jgi:hypothetical protein